MPHEKEARWPYLLSEGYQVTSGASWDYNCIAFAAGIETEWWWPDPNGDASWPKGIGREERVECFVDAFATLGYEVCQHGELEPGFEEIALYAANGVPTHAAKQTSDGRWKSKLGGWEDIEHDTVRALEEHVYGKVVLFMRRKVAAM